MNPRAKMALVGAFVGLIAVFLIFGAFGAGYLVARAGQDLPGPGIASSLEEAVKNALSGGLRSHGAVGTVVSTSDSSLVLKMRNGAEKRLLLNSDTLIAMGRRRVQPADLRQGDVILALGSPADEPGSFRARYVRVLKTTKNGDSALWLKLSAGVPSIIH